MCVPTWTKGWWDGRELGRARQVEGEEFCEEMKVKYGTSRNIKQSSSKSSEENRVRTSAHYQSI
jgi:hypothetical protein